MANPLKTSFSRTTDDLGRPQQPQLLHTELVNILRGYSRSKRTLVGASIVKRRSELGRDQPSLCIQRFHNGQESKHDLQCESNPLPCNCEPLSKIGWLLTWKLFQELESAVHWSDGYTMLIGLSLWTCWYFIFWWSLRLSLMLSSNSTFFQWSFFAEGSYF